MNLLCKIHVLFFCSLLIITSSYSQLVANAGPDVRWCNSNIGTPSPYIGSAQVATGGIPPYKYKWTLLQYPNSNGNYLNYDTIANPRIGPWPLGAMKFGDYQLMVTDSTGQTAYDTMRIYVSGFAYSLDPCIYDMAPGDTTVLVPNVTGGSFGYLPITYVWTPALYLSNDSTQYPLCWASVNIAYTVHAIDSVGCMDSDLVGPCYVNISTGVNNVKKKELLSIYPNPVNSNSVVSVPAEYIGSSMIFTP